VEVVTRGENIRDVREARLLARSDLSRSELEAAQSFERQQTEFELLGRLEAAVEEEVGADIDLQPGDVQFTEEVSPTGTTRIGIGLTEDFVGQDLPQQLRGEQAPTAGPQFDPDPVEFLGIPIEQASLDAARGIATFGREELAPDTAEFAGELARFAGFEPDPLFEADIEDALIGGTGIVAGVAGLPAGVAGFGRELTPQRLEARQERARALTFEVPTGGGLLDGDEDIETREVSDSLAFGIPATIAQDVVTDPVSELVEAEGRRGAAIQIGAQLVGTAALFGATSAISPRLGAGTRLAIQPGEEILGRGGFAATRRAFGEQAAQRAFPNREPLIFSEEAFIRGLRRAAPSDPGIIPALRSGELPPSPLQRARIRSLREQSPAPPSARSDLGTPESELFEGIGGPRGRTEVEVRQEEERTPGRTGITEEQRRIAEEITRQQAAESDIVRIAGPQEARLRQFTGGFEIERTERLGAGLVPPFRIRRAEPELDPVDRGIFRDFRAQELEARREQFRDFNTGVEAEFEQRLAEAERSTVRARAELEAETEDELDSLGFRTQFALGNRASELTQPIEAFEFEPPRLAFDIEQEFETEFETEFARPIIETERPPEETETERPPSELEPPREIELFDSDPPDDEALEFGVGDPFGVRAVETTIRALEEDG
jgi:hypothetical protein